MPLVPASVAVAQAPALTPEEIAACGSVEDASALCLAVYRATGNALVAGLSDTLLVTPAKILLILALAFLAARVVRRAIRRSVESVTAGGVGRRLGRLRGRTPRLLLATGPVTSVRAAQRAETVAALLRSTATMTIWTIAVLMALSELGLNLGPLIAGAGIIGIALGFGAQNLVRDFLSGIFMLVEDQYGVGDVIDAGPASGVVEAVSLRTTRLRDVNGVVWHIPNGTISRIGNKSQQWSRALLDIPVAYGTDVTHATAVIAETASGMWKDEEWQDRILEEPEVWGVERFDADGIAIRLVVKTVPSEQWAVARELRARIKEAFDAAGIEIPFPQRVVWHRSEEPVKQPARDRAAAAARRREREQAP